MHLTAYPLLVTNPLNETAKNLVVGPLLALFCVTGAIVTTSQINGTCVCAVLKYEGPAALSPVGAPLPNGWTMWVQPRYFVAVLAIPLSTVRIPSRAVGTVFVLRALLKTQT